MSWLLKKLLKNPKSVWGLPRKSFFKNNKTSNRFSFIAILKEAILRSKFGQALMGETPEEKTEEEIVKNTSEALEILQEMNGKDRG